MPRPERRYGTIPSSRRRLAAVVCLVVGALVVIGGLLVSFLSAAPVKWGWLIVVVGFAMGFTGLYVWIRLSD